MKWLAAGFAVFIVSIIIMEDTGHLGLFDLVYALPFGDKAGHFVLFGVLNLLVILAALEMRPRLDPLKAAVVVSLALCVLTGIEEYSQRFFPGRTSSIFDWLAGFAGIVVFAWIAVRIEGRRKARQGS